MRPRLKPIGDQVMLITGASSGIGLVTARMAAKRGAKLMLVARNGEALAAIAAAIEADGGEAAFAVADVADHDQLAAAADAAIARFGRIDSWVNNAGVGIYGMLLDITPDEQLRLFRTNYLGVANGSQIAVRHMRESGGAIITIGSIVSDMPSPVMASYAASKHAAKAYTEALRMELAADGVPIAVTLIKPSGIDTPVADHALSHEEGRPLIPPPSYVPELVARAILHAASHVRRSITVGGVGRAEVLIANHFPWLLDWATPMIRRTLVDRSGEKPPLTAFATPGEGGRERSGVQSPRRLSLYTEAVLHPRLSAIAAVALLGGGLALARRRHGRA